ncbi:MAG: phosphatase PAP2 family protein [Gemmatimonadota bacterium]|nr:phosphatase PAP2 family protein [Gemmatimonadota bacterium]
MRRLGFILLILAARPCMVPAQARDSTAPPPLFAARDAAYAGAFVLGTLAIAPLDKAIADYLQGAPQAHRLLHPFSRTVEIITFPGAFVIGGGLYGAGRLAKNREMAELGLHGSEAIVIGLGVTSLLKYGVGRARPYVARNPHDYGFGRGLHDERYRSFPSGHTLIAFAAAAAVTQETSEFWPHSTWYVAPAMYGGATLVGLSRMYNNKHWASDVIMGAAIGTFSGLKVVKYHHDRPGNRLDRWLLGASLSGTGEGNVLRLLALPIRGSGGG